MENGIDNISVWGDSILKGAITGTDSGHLFDIIADSSLPLAQKWLGFNLNNNSVFGSVILKSMRRMKKDLSNGIKTELGIIESGGNDCDYDWSLVSENPSQNILPRTSLHDFIEIINNMVLELRANKITPLIMTMPPLVSARWFEHICQGRNKQNILKFVNNNPDRLYQNHEMYNIALLKYGYENNVQIIDMRMEILKYPSYTELMCKDGIHPNEDGYKFMSEVWIKKLPLVKREF